MTFDILRDKQCRDCKEVKDINDYYSEMRKNGLYIYPHCKPCFQAARVEGDRKYRMVKNYNISSEQYDEMLEAQGACCAICGKTPEQNGQKLSVDHDHKCCPDKSKSCGKCVRGLLCKACNHAIGLLNDDPDLFLSALSYVIQKENVIGEIV